MGSLTGWFNRESYGLVQWRVLRVGSMGSFTGWFNGKSYGLVQWGVLRVGSMGSFTGWFNGEFYGLVQWRVLRVGSMANLTGWFNGEFYGLVQWGVLRVGSMGSFMGWFNRESYGLVQWGVLQVAMWYIYEVIYVWWHVLNRTEEVLPYGVDDTLVGVLPFFHIYGQVVVMLTGLLQGALTVTMPTFDPDLFLNIIQNHRVCWCTICEGTYCNTRVPR